MCYYLYLLQRVFEEIGHHLQRLDFDRVSAMQLPYKMPVIKSGTYIFSYSESSYEPSSLEVLFIRVDG